MFTDRKYLMEKYEYIGSYLKVKVMDSPAGPYETIETKTKHGAHIIVLCQNEVLLVQQFRPPVNTLTWEFPGGVVEDGEDIKLGAIREVKEEANVDVPVESLQLVSVTYLSPSLMDLTITIYLGRVSDDFDKTLVFPQESEIETIGWFDVDELILSYLDNPEADITGVAAQLILAKALKLL